MYNKKLRLETELLLSKQQAEFTNNGLLLKNLLGISASHPWLSLIFVLSFTLFTNFFARIIVALLVATNNNYSIASMTGLAIVCFLIMAAIILYLRTQHRDLFQQVSLEQKKVLVTLVSHRSKDDKTEIPAAKVIDTFMADSLHNLLEKVVLVRTESATTARASKHLKRQFGNNENLSLDTHIIDIEHQSIPLLQKQLEELIIGLLTDWKPYEIIADYTGGTKAMSIALFRACERHLVLPVYLKEASSHKYSNTKGVKGV